MVEGPLNHGNRQEDVHLYFYAYPSVSNWLSQNVDFVLFFKFIMDAREKSRATILESSKHNRVPIFVMMPVNTLGIDSSGSPRIRKIKALTISLRALKLADWWSQQGYLLSR
ncbi:inactive beta-amylase 4, chloroplastic-like isoform X2 [Hevea brasiliensis]|uniref:inactive beta-amylase 4, chloroplastic-like isoform X2 n=1 Tax=Hevea brasiliensis TaxID=3981 RepID=UPI0025FD1F5F|nr:inactive beta-amylase 4, chloroplastic-like isoform X2 [Hevea brasiliensis]